MELGLNPSRISKPVTSSTQGQLLLLLSGSESADPGSLSDFATEMRSQGTSLKLQGSDPHWFSPGDSLGLTRGAVHRIKWDREYPATSQSQKCHMGLSDTLWLSWQAKKGTNGRKPFLTIQFSISMLLKASVSRVFPPSL